jgi:hypothetical protein
MRCQRFRRARVKVRLLSQAGLERSRQNSIAASSALQRQTTPFSARALSIDSRPEAVGQRKLAEAVGSSPHLVAQRTQFAGMFGQAMQRKSPEEELQKKSASGASVTQRQDSAVASKSANRSGLPDNLKAGIESLSGLDLSEVRVHYNSGKPAQLSALAYAQGDDVHVAPEEERHLPHEAWHVVQQR